MSTYAQVVAAQLGFEWEHLPLTATDLGRSIASQSRVTGALVSPIHLHRMDWFAGHRPDAMVIAGSYGDSVGRAEFSGLHVLDLPRLRPPNTFGLLRSTLVHEARRLMATDQAALDARAPGAAHHVLCEHERQGHYMRNMMVQSMTVIDTHVPVYQMFTAPEVFGAMWSLHPAARTNDVYTALLERLGHDLVHIPWARNNRPLRGPAKHQRDLPRSFNHYSRWTSEDLRPDLQRLVEPAWFGETGVFDQQAVSRLSEAVRRDPGAEGKHGVQPHERFLWLAAVRTLAEELMADGRDLVAPTCDTAGVPDHEPSGLGMGRMRTVLWQMQRSLLNRAAMRPLQRRLIEQRHRALVRSSLRNLPPQPWPEDQQDDA